MMIRAYGEINYIYNETHVMLVALLRLNDKVAGKAVFAWAYAGEWIDSENTESSEVLVRVRACDGKKHTRAGLFVALDTCGQK